LGKKDNLSQCYFDAASRDFAQAVRATTRIITSSYVATFSVFSRAVRCAPQMTSFAHRTRPRDDRGTWAGHTRADTAPIRPNLPDNRSNRPCNVIFGQFSPGSGPTPALNPGQRLCNRLMQYDLCQDTQPASLDSHHGGSTPLTVDDGGATPAHSGRFAGTIHPNRTKTPPVGGRCSDCTGLFGSLILNEGEGSNLQV